MLATMMHVSCCQAAFRKLTVAARLALTVRVAELLQERDTNH
jgi:hypothetical protein